MTEREETTEICTPDFHICVSRLSPACSLFASLTSSLCSFFISLTRTRASGPFTPRKKEKLRIRQSR